MKKINIACYNCNSTQSTLYATENGYNYVKCSYCGLIYLNPRPVIEEINTAQEVGMHRGNKVLTYFGKYKKGRIKKYIRILQDFYDENELQKTNSKWLDIGCGYGEFMESLLIYSDSQVKVKGSEFNKFKIQSCKDRNLEVDFIDLAKHKDKYDYVSLLNVFSHLPNPIEFLEKIIKILNPMGELLLETGHTCHLPVEHHLKPFYAPDHLSFANKDIVEGILKRAGFDILKTVIYRFQDYPVITDVKGISFQIARIILNRGGSWKNFFPKYPDGDMYIKAKLKIGR